VNFILHRLALLYLFCFFVFTQDVEMSVPPNYYHPGTYDYSKAPNPYMQQGYALPQGYAAPQGYGQQNPGQQRELTPSNSLWVGDLEPWMDENYVTSMFMSTGEVSGVKLIRDKTTGLPAGYGFVYFKNIQGSESAMKNLNGQPIPQLPNKRYKLNWASHGTGASAKPTTPTNFAPRPQAPPQQHTQPTHQAHQATSTGADDQKALFVGDLAADVTDQVLLQTFQYYYPSVYNARVVIDPRTGQSKGYGFVYFSDDKEKTRALTEMQGFYVSYKPIKLNYATKKSQAPGVFQAPPGPYAQPQYSYPYPPYQQPQYGYPYPYPQQTYAPQQPVYQRRPRPAVDPAQDPTNTTLFVGGLDLSVNADQLKGKFEPFGEVAGIRIQVGKGCAFVEYKNRNDAEAALKGLGNTIQIGNSTARVFWGRPQKPQPNQPSTPTQSSSNQGQSTSESEDGQSHQESQQSESETYNPAETYDYQEYYNREEPSNSPPPEGNGTLDPKKRELEQEGASESSEEPSSKRAKTQSNEAEEGETSKPSTEASEPSETSKPSAETTTKTEEKKAGK